MRPIITVENLGKEYVLGSARAGYSTFRETVLETVRAPWRRRGAGGRAAEPRVWALRDLDFEVMPGEVVGIIGRNGAGKSTLLKILSRITEPTTGTVQLYGRVGSLLEVGTGFHPELTGRENIYLNGTILGMRRQEVERKFDEIVAFAEVGEFLDTPVKRYSSGMYMRLAFALAAHLEPEILVVDEVLAVGDAAFQKKCLGKMGEVARAGRTVLFVSHNMAAVESLCQRAFLLTQGRLQAIGEPRDLIAQYLASTLEAGSGQEDLTAHPNRVKGSVPIMTGVTLASGADAPVSSFSMSSPVSVRVSFESEQALRPASGLVVKSAQGIPIFAASSRFIDGKLPAQPVRAGTVTWEFDRLPLMPGTYFLDLYFGDQLNVSQELDTVHESISFEVLPADVFGTGRLPHPSGGPVVWPARWTLSETRG